MRNPLLRGGLLSLLTACSGGGAEVPPAPAPFEIDFPAVAPLGVFDPSLAFEASTGRLWMAYSAVADSMMWPGRNTAIHSRLASSDDGGASWDDAGLALNTAVDVVIPLPPPNEAGTWTNEVPCLVEDPGAPAAERWKLFWHHYLVIDGVRQFQHGWIGMISAPALRGPWSDERKLFVGSIYDPADDAILGAPEVHVETLHPDLALTVACTEPGAIATADSLFVTMLAAAAAPNDGRIILLELPRDSGTWQYRGTFLRNGTDAAAFGHDGFSAPSLYADGAVLRLIVTPQTANVYHGTLVFEVADLLTASLVRDAGVPRTVFELAGPPGTHSGAADFEPQASASGLVYSEVLLTPPLHFRILASRRRP